MVLFGLLVVTIGLRAPYMFNISLAKGFDAETGSAEVELKGVP